MNNNQYFSKANVDFLQNKLIEIVKERHKISLTRQSDIELKIIMKGIYKHFGFRTNTDEELLYLNNITIHEMYKQVKTGLEQYFHYIKKINNPISPLSYGIQTRESSKSASTTRIL